jgi:hypothetical protein
MMRDKYRGALLGLAAGDALGTTLEFSRHAGAIAKLIMPGKDQGDVLSRSSSASPAGSLAVFWAVSSEGRGVRPPRDFHRHHRRRAPPDRLWIAKKEIVVTIDHLGQSFELPM